LPVQCPPASADDETRTNAAARTQRVAVIAALAAADRFVSKDVLPLSVPDLPSSAKRRSIATKAFQATQVGSRRFRSL
jgi:hypothetical protein